MDKPLSIILQETKESIIKIINESNLNPCLIRPIIKDIYFEVEQASRQELLQDKKKYQEEHEKSE